MTKTRTPAVVPEKLEIPAEAVLAESPSLRDEFAMRMAAAILTGIASRGGMDAAALTCDNDKLVTVAYALADNAMRARAAS